MLNFSSSPTKGMRTSPVPATTAADMGGLQLGNPNKLEAMLLRDDKLTKAENLTAKFLEAADGYHRIVKKTIEKRGHKGTGCSSVSPRNSPPPRS